jgi:hypothetical protein
MPLFKHCPKCERPVLSVNNHDCCPMNEMDAQSGLPMEIDIAIYVVLVVFVIVLVICVGRIS